MGKVAMFLKNESDSTQLEADGMKHDLSLRQGRRAERVESTSSVGQAIVTGVLSGYLGPVGIRLWDNRLAAGSPNSDCIVVFRESWVLRDLVLYRDLSRLAEAYLIGAVEVEGDLEALFDLDTFLTQLRIPVLNRLWLGLCALRLPRRSNRRSGHQVTRRTSRRNNSRASIAHHYDLGNDFYGLWLDPEYVYSCAYFRDPDQPLAEAQQEKLDYICRKLRLTPGQSLLDIGCGWGALALWAARHYGVHVRGITLSERQYEFATARVRNAGLADQIEFELIDYRELDDGDRYDRIVSVGMFEHVGVRNFRRYFETVLQRLKPGGLFLNHGITSSTDWRRTPLTQFINRYVFPDGELARLSVVTDAMEQSGFELLDIESLRPHYALTLHQWVSALEKNHKAAIDMTSATTYKLWRLYMAGSAHYFREGSIGVYQVLAGCAQGPQSVPLRRDDLYAAREI